VKTKLICLQGLAVLMAALNFGCKPSRDPATPANSAETKGTAGISTPDGNPKVKTFSSLDRPDSHEKQELLAGAIKFEDADLGQALSLYQSLSGRTVVRSGALPEAKISLQNEMPLTRREALQALDTVLAQNNITMILLGTKFVKAVPSAQAPTEAAPVIELAPDELPESSSYMLYVVELKNLIPREVAQAVQPFAKMPNSILGIDDARLLILRDYSANIRRMLKVIEKMEQSPEAGATPFERLRRRRQELIERTEQGPKPRPTPDER
jgi:type II secretory pathway component GspD/PulD (secretin)